MKPCNLLPLRLSPSNDCRRAPYPGGRYDFGRGPSGNDAEIVTSSRSNLKSLLGTNPAASGG